MDDIEEHQKMQQLLKVSNPDKVLKNARHYFNDPNIKIYISSHKKSKYAIYDPIHQKLVHFGHIDYEDFTKHNDKKRQQNYLLRASNMKGNWKDNPYSPNNLSIALLWM